MTKPLTPAGCDLRDFPHTPLFRARLFGSAFHARATDAEWRAGVTLWLKSWDQVPAGSLPDDDIELCRLAELARDMKQWRKVRSGSLRGWIVCTDGRLYHPVVAEGVNTALEAKSAQRAKTAKARLAAMEKRLKECKTDAERAHVSEEISKMKQAMSKAPSIESTDRATESVTDGATESVTDSKRREGEGEGEGEEITLSEANASGVAKTPPTPRDMVFANGVTLLTAAGVSDKNARSFLAAQCKTHGDEVVLQALTACAEESPIQPVPWLQAALKSAPSVKKGSAAQSFRERDAEAAKEVARRWMGSCAPNTPDSNVIDMEEVNARISMG